MIDLKKESSTMSTRRSRDDRPQEGSRLARLLRRSSEMIDLKKESSSTC